MKHPQGIQMISKISAVLFSFGLAFSAAAAENPQPSSTLTKMEGKVSVNTGKEFVPGLLDMRLKEGDRVMTGNDSGATIVFDDKCRLEIEENKLVTLPDSSTCAGGVLVQQGIEPGGATAIGATGGRSAWPIVAAVVIGGALLFNEDERDTCSP